MRSGQRAAGLLLASSAVGLTAGCQDKMAPWTAASTPVSAFQGAQDVSFAPMDMPGASARAQCAADAVDGAPVMPGLSRSRGEVLALEGWVATSLLRDPGQFSVVLDGERDFGGRLETNVARPDVAATLKSPLLANAGFRVHLKLDVPPGRYALAYLLQGEGGPEACTLGIEIDIR